MILKLINGRVQREEGKFYHLFNSFLFIFPPSFSLMSLTESGRLSSVDFYFRPEDFPPLTTAHKLASGDQTKSADKEKEDEPPVRYFDTTIDGACLKYGRARAYSFVASY